MENPSLNIEKDYILIVDDDTEVTDAVCSYFDPEGMTVARAIDERSALAVIARRTPMLISLDILLTNDHSF